MCKVVSVKFKTDNYNNKTYDYHYPDEFPTPTIGDCVVVDSPSQGYVTVTIEAIKSISSKANKWIVCPVNDSLYKKRIENEKRANKIERLLNERLEELEKLLDIRF